MEMSHRSPRFQEIAQEAEQNLRQLLFIPQHYKILFLGWRSESVFYGADEFN